MDEHEKKQPELLHCLRCGEEWQPRYGTRPIQCPRCKSPRWDRPRKREGLTS